MTHGERFNAVMNSQRVDRYPRIEWAAFWDKTVDRWRKEGLNPALRGAESIRERLGLDNYSQFWLGGGGR